MKLVKLKPCPFCGRAYRGQCRSDLDNRFECPRCGAKSPFVNRDILKKHGAEFAVTESWNRRTGDE